MKSINKKIPHHGGGPAKPATAAAGKRTRGETKDLDSGTPGKAAGTQVSDIMPLAVQLATMRELWTRAVEGERIVDLECAKQACALAKDTAPFVHPRLASVDHSGDMTVRHEDWLDSLPAPDPGGVPVLGAPAHEKPR